jgi:hypothetical protein
LKTVWVPTVCSMAGSLEGEVVDFRPFRGERTQSSGGWGARTPTIAPNTEPMLDSWAMRVSAGKLFEIPRSLALLGSLALLLRR